MLPKLIIIDAGGVLHPDSDLGGINQAKLHDLSQWDPAKLDALQDHEQLNLGNIPLRSVFETIITNTPNPPFTLHQLEKAYLEGISLYPGAANLLRHFITCGYKIVLLTNNSDVGVSHTKSLLQQEALPMITVYGSAEIHINKPSSEAFLYVCNLEKVDPRNCLFIDDRVANLTVAEQLGMRSLAFQRPIDHSQAIDSMESCLQALIAQEVIFCPGFIYDEHLPENRGIYPSFFGLYENNHIRIHPKKIIDEPNKDGNLRKHCLYETLLAKLICEDGRAFWQPAYQKINRCFLTDFSVKTQHKEQFLVFFSKIKRCLEKISQPLISHADDIESLYLTLQYLFSEPIDLAQVSQFYYELWLEPYGPEQLEPFVFSVEALCQHLPVTDHKANLRILSCGDLVQSAATRKLAYFIAQPYASCGRPQLRGREQRPSDIRHSNTIGILSDQDPLTKSLKTKVHYAAKQAFQPCRKHPIAQDLQDLGAAVIGGTSGTLGRNILMLAPLVASGLISQTELLQYCMGFWADLVYRGHHSYEEIALVFSQVVMPLKSWLDPLRTPKAFYEQLLTEEFLQSEHYQNFSTQHQDFFDAPISDLNCSM